MKIKKYLLFILIFVIVLNISGIYATDDNSTEIGIYNENSTEWNENTLNTYENLNETSPPSKNNELTQEILTQSNDENILSITPYNTEITLSINDTSNFETTGNITINMYFRFETPTYDGFNAYDINIYENNTIIQKLNIGEQNLPEITNYKYSANVQFNYTVHPESYLTTSLFGIYSNTLHFKEIKNINLTDLNNSQIIIDDIYLSNKWNNSIKSFEKALNLAMDNGTIILNNINFQQDTSETIQINKNISIIGKNASFILEKTKTLLEIQPNTKVTLVNLTFKGNNYYIISNKGNLKLINCTFKDNNLGLINNYNQLELEDCKIEDINQFYQTKPTNTNGLITNIKTLKITNTNFNNNLYLPYSLPTETNSLKGIIYNNGNLSINNVTFTNINYRILYNDGRTYLNNILFENILSSSNTIIHTLSTNQQLNTNYNYNNYQIQTKSKIIDGGVIYNNNESIIVNLSFKNIIGSNGGTIFNNKNITIINSTFQKITGDNGGVIYNNNTINIVNSTFYTISGRNGGAIYNDGKLNIENTLFNNTQSKSQDTNGGAIYNKKECNINNSTITESKIVRGYGGGIYNDGTLTVNNTIISKCSSTGGKFIGSGGIGVYNNGIISISNSQIINNNAPYPMHIIKYVEQSNGDIFTYITNVYGGVISNNETGKATITKTIIKDNTIRAGTNGNWQMYYGTIKNDGFLEISGCIFDNNKPSDWDQHFGGEGAITIYNTGKLTFIYNYFFNTQDYTGSPHDPLSFLYNIGTSTLNYNFFFLNPNSIIRNAKANNYFIVAFDDDYYPIKFNESRNITLYLNLTDGSKIVDFSDWDKLPEGGLKTTITLNINETNYNINTTLTKNATFLFTNTNFKGEYLVNANIEGYIISSIVDLGKEYANMTVNYNNITYNDGNNVTFKINVTGNNTPLTGNITLELNNQKYTLTLVNGSCNFTAPTDLKPNTYTVKITYEGNDDYFKIKNQYYSFTIHKIPINITLDAPEIKIGQTGKLTIKISPPTSKMEGLLYVNGKVKTRADTTSIRTIDLKNYGVGIYNLTVIFDEDEYYLGGKASILFIVSKYETNLTLESKDINAGENATINVTITPGDVRGDIILEINGVNQSGYLSAATTTITLTNLQNGTYHVTVYYPGDAKYLPSNATTTFNVARKSTQLNVTITNNPDLTGNIVVKTNYINCTGPVGVYINNYPRLTLNLTQGMANFTVKFKRGTNLIYVYYLGDEYYSFATWNTTIPIEGKAIITTNNTQFTEQNTDNYIIHLKDTDNNPYEYTPITVEFKNQNSTITTDENGIAYYPVTSKAGTYNITIKYKNYTKQDTLTVKPSTINIDIKDILAGQSEIITVTLSNNATGNITFTLDNTPYNRTLTNASTVLEVPNLSLGLHNLTITYSGDENFINQTITQTFYIKNSISWITLQSTNTVYGEAITVKATVIAGATGNVTFQIANQTQTVTLTGNTAEATFKNISAGDKIITAHYNGDSIYQGSDNSIKISVARANTTLEIITSELKVNENILITALINPDATGNVTFRIQGQYSPRNRTITDGNSSWLISPLNSGSYKLIVIYNGDNNYNSITHEEILIINRIESKLTIKIGDVSDGDDLMVYATLTDINNRKVTDNITLEINGKYYKIIITNGAGSRNLGEFKAGKYTYSATYNGNNILAMAIADGEFNVVKSNYKITGNTDITQYYGATKYYKIRLTNNNQPVKGEIITVTINKNTVKIKTDTQGY